MTKRYNALVSFILEKHKQIDHIGIVYHDTVLVEPDNNKDCDHMCHFGLKYDAATAAFRSTVKNNRAYITWTYIPDEEAIWRVENFYSKHGVKFFKHWDPSHFKHDKLPLW